MRITSQELHPMRVQYTCYMIETETYIYMNFQINSTQFYINFSRQEHQI